MQCLNRITANETKPYHKVFSMNDLTLESQLKMQLANLATLKCFWNNTVCFKKVKVN